MSSRGVGFKNFREKDPHPRLTAWDKSIAAPRLRWMSQVTQKGEIRQRATMVFTSGWTSLMMSYHFMLFLVARSTVVATMPNTAPKSEKMIRLLITKKE